VDEEEEDEEVVEMEEESGEVADWQLMATCSFRQPAYV
jgi:hypothetical protein